jgi:hypothetical protein
MAEPTGLVEPAIMQLLSLGAPGAVIIALGFAAYRFYNRNQELTDTLITMTRETVKAQEAATDAINRLTDLLRSTRRLPPAE